MDRYDPEHLDRWHTLWVHHLEAQRGLNPNHSSDPGEPGSYRRAAHNYRLAAETSPGGGKHLWHKQIETAESKIHHDLVAALEVFNARAHARTAHLGLTSCDITDVANQMRVADGFYALLAQVRGVIYRLTQTMGEHAETLLVARTHGRPAQLSTYGHRIATILGPLCDWYDRAARAEEEYPMRPPHGAVGTAADLARVLTGRGSPPEAPATGPGATGSASDASAGTETPPGVPEAPEGLREAERTLCQAMVKAGVDPQVAVEAAGRAVQSIRDHGLANEVGDLTEHRSPQYDIGYRVAEAPPPDGVEVTTGPRESNPYSPAEAVDLYTAQIQARLGFSDSMDTTRQVYHRSYDLHLAGLLAELASIAQTYATDRRLEAMLGLGTETFIDGQVGSSAMPHKRNPIRSERICALAVLTRSNLSACAEIAGMEWFEGDVSTSAARRVVLPQMLDNAHQLVENWLTVADGWQVAEGELKREVYRWLPILATGALMQAAIEAGLPRQQAHSILSQASEWWSEIVSKEVTPGSLDQLFERHLMLFINHLAAFPDWPLNYDQSRVVAINACHDIGNVAAQIRLVRTHADRITS